MTVMTRGCRPRAERVGQRPVKVVQGEPVVAALRCAVRDALLDHKRAGNPIAVWKDGKVVIIPAEEIQVEESPDDSERS